MPDAAPHALSRALDDLDRIAIRVDRLTVNARDPERFFIERSDVVDDLRRLIVRFQGFKSADFREAREAKHRPSILPPSGSAKDINGLRG